MVISRSPVGTQYTSRTVRYIPFASVTYMRQYLRVLFTGRFHRIQQLAPDDGHALTRGLTEMCYELNAEPNLYPWKALRRALYGLNTPFAKTQVFGVQSLLRSFETTSAPRRIAQ